MTEKSAAGIARVGDAVAAEVWLIDCGQLCLRLERLEAAEPRLSDEEIGRGDRIANEGERSLWRAAHIALRLLIERWAGPALRRVPFDYERTGRPLLPHPAPSFSLAHSGRRALVGLTRPGVIGVDLQEVTKRLIKEERRQRLEDYAVGIAHGAPLPVDRDTRFIQAWTRIEALAKADGKGIGRTLTEAGLIGSRAIGAPAPGLRVQDVAAGAGFAGAVAASVWSPGLGETLNLCDILDPGRARSAPLEGCG